MSEWTSEAPKAINVFKPPTVADLLTRRIIAIVHDALGYESDIDWGWDVKIDKAVQSAFQYADLELETWRREGFDRLAKQLPQPVFVCARCGNELKDEGADK